MPTRLPITDQDRARRHVLGQQLYRLRKHYQFLLDARLYANAEMELVHIRAKEREYNAVGGKPKHKGNVL